MVVTSPFQLGQDITTNGVCCAAFRNPPHQQHMARPLPGQTLEVGLPSAPGPPAAINPF